MTKLLGMIGAAMLLGATVLMIRHPWGPLAIAAAALAVLAALLMAYSSYFYA